MDSSLLITKFTDNMNIFAYCFYPKKPCIHF